MAQWVVKNAPANVGDARHLGSIPGLGRSPGGGNGNPLQYSCLKNSMDRGAWWATVQGVSKSCTWLNDQAHTHTHTHTPLSVLLYNVHPWHPGPQSLPFAYVNQSKSRAYYNEVSPHTGQKGHQSKGLYKQWMLERVWRKKRTLLHCWWECKLVQPSWRTVCSFL